MKNRKDEQHRIVEQRIGAGLVRRTCQHCGLLEVDRTSDPFVFADGTRLQDLRAALRRKAADPA